VTNEELRVALTSIRSTYLKMQESIEGETNLDFADQMIYESEEYLMGEVINLFNDMDEEEVDWGQVNRENLAATLKSTFEDFGTVGDVWLAVADKAIEILLGGEEVA
jgi:hypothetical protein